MRFPLRLSTHGPGRKLLAAAVIAVGAAGLAELGRQLPVVSIPLAKLDDLLYDSMYRLRKPEDRTNGPVVIVAVDQASLDELLNPKANKRKFGWPWPREIWGYIVGYLDRCGAREVVFDMVFTEPSAYGDDSLFAKRVNAAKVPVVFATKVMGRGKLSDFAPHDIARGTFGAVTPGDLKVVQREYDPLIEGFPSLASSAVGIARGSPIPLADRFLLHFYGPYMRPEGRQTFRYLKASAVFGAAAGQPTTLDPGIFRDKIVLIGTIAAGTYDAKASPLSDPYPGVEVQATAIENLLAGKRVKQVPEVWGVFATIFVAMLASIGIVAPRGAALKLAAAMASAGALFGCGAFLFLGQQIYWLPLAAPVAALAMATVGSFAWTYAVEDRERRLVLKAFSQYVSPQVVAEIARDYDSLKLGGEDREMTVMFTDIQGFTDLSEQLEVDKLSTLLNYYLGEMSSLVLATNGTLDKYIGDAIMSFWNAPLRQPDHAVLACRAALALVKREAEIQPDLQRLGAASMLTRIGINSGRMKVGNMGSPQKFNYSVLGDSVNLGSRLEGSNKLYGSRILIAQTTADQVRGHFVMRQLDLLQVKGKKIPMAVFELMAEGNVDGDLQFRVSAYETAFALYQKQKWDEAEAALEPLREKCPADEPAAALVRRIAYYRQHPPGDDWDGVYESKSK